MERGSFSCVLETSGPGLWLCTDAVMGTGPRFSVLAAGPCRAHASQLSGQTAPGGLLPPTTQPVSHSEASGRARLSRAAFPKFQFLLINIISAPVQVNKLTPSDEPEVLPVPNDVILTSSDECRSLFPSGTQEGWGLTDRGRETVALTLLFDGSP